MFAIGGNALTWVAAVVVMLATIALPIFAVWMEIERGGANPDESE